MINGMKKALALTMLALLGVMPLAAQTNEDKPATAPQEEKTNLVESVSAWYMDNMNYGTVSFLMVIESSFIPFPSEVVVPPAAYKALEEDSDMNIVLVVVFATLGAIVGAVINYYLALWLGRPIIYKFAEKLF